MSQAEQPPNESAAELALLSVLAAGVKDAQTAVDEAIAKRNREIVRAVDYYSIDAVEVATSTGITPARVSQILAEVS